MKNYFFGYYLFSIVVMQLFFSQLESSENTIAIVDDNGSVVAIWQEDTLSGTEIKSTARSYLAFVWEPEVVLSLTPIASKPVLAVIANGLDTMSVAIWTEVIGGTVHLFGAMRPSLLGGWTAGALISDGIEDIVGDYQLTINSSGNAIASWSSITGGLVASRSSESTINLLNSWPAPLGF